jgi:hypothetical protein
MDPLKIALDKIVEMNLAGGELHLRFIDGYGLAPLQPRSIKIPQIYSTVQEIAARTRFCAKTVRGWVREGCPAYRINGEIRFDDDEVDVWLTNRKVGGRLK